MSIFTRISFFVTLFVLFCGQSFDVVFAMEKLPKKRAQMSAEQRQHLSNLAKARAASRRSLAAETSRSEQEEAELAQAIQRSLEGEAEVERRVRPRKSEVIEISDDDSIPADPSSSAESEDLSVPIFSNEDIEQMHGLEQGRDNLCGIYALYFARVFAAEGGARNFTEEVDRAAFDRFLAAEVRPIKFERPRGTGTVLQEHRLGTFYGQDELAFVAHNLDIRCFIGDLRAGFFDETRRVHPAVELHGLAQQIKAGAAPETCVIFNTGAHWITIFITKTKLYLVDSRNCEVRCETEAVQEFIARIWRA